MTRSEILPAVPTSVGSARRFALQALDDTPGPMRDDVVLMVSELATNAVLHGLTSFHLAVQRTQREIRVEVTDFAGGVPALDPHPDNGRQGLHIVDLLATRWGVCAGSESGKTVWFTLSVPPERHRSAPA